MWKFDNQGVKEETFIQVSRRGRDGAAGVERNNGKAVARGLGQERQCWQTGRSHICVQINREEQLGSETDRRAQGSSREIKPQTSD